MNQLVLSNIALNIACLSPCQNRPFGSAQTIKAFFHVFPCLSTPFLAHFFGRDFSKIPSEKKDVPKKKTSVQNGKMP